MIHDSLVLDTSEQQVLNLWIVSKRYLQIYLEKLTLYTAGNGIRVVKAGGEGI
jgi:hypothetical protein